MCYIMILVSIQFSILATVWNSSSRLLLCRCSHLSGADREGSSPRWRGLFQSRDAVGSQWRKLTEGGTQLLVFLILVPVRPLLLRGGGAGGRGGLGAQSALLCSLVRTWWERQQAGKGVHRDDRTHPRSDTGRWWWWWEWEATNTVAL